MRLGLEGGNGVNFVRRPNDDDEQLGRCSLVAQCIRPPVQLPYTHDRCSLFLFPGHIAKNCYARGGLE